MSYIDKIIDELEMIEYQATEMAELSLACTMLGLDNLAKSLDWTEEQLHLAVDNIREALTAQQKELLDQARASMGQAFKAALEKGDQ